MSKEITIQMSREDAIKFDLLVCKCGHRINNHFTNRGCGHCNCKKYKEKPRVGKLIKLLIWEKNEESPAR